MLAVGAGGGCLAIFSLVYLFSFLSPSLRETARNRLKYCLKGPLNPKQPTNQYILRYMGAPPSFLSFQRERSNFCDFLGPSRFGSLRAKLLLEEQILSLRVEPY